MSTVTDISRARPNADWKSELRFDHNQKIIADEENVVRILRHDPSLNGLLSFNEFADETLLLREIPYDSRHSQPVPRRWRDEDSAALQAYIQRSVLPRIALGRIESAVQLFSKYGARFHPLRDYLSSLVWDGRPRVEHWLVDYLGATSPEPYVCAVGKAWLISAVARVSEPGCQADSALVLEGAQGIGKSTALRTMAGNENFSDSLPHDLSQKDSRAHLRGKWIVELPELAQFRKSEIETVKAFLTRRFEEYRPAYGRHEISWPRQCVFAGTTNESEYLVDSTGNRRFWCVKVGVIDLQALTRDRDQLWAEAVHLFNADTPWHLTGEADEAAANESKIRVMVDPWTGMVASLLADRLMTEATVAPGEILNSLDIAKEQRHARSAGRIGTILLDLGWVRGKRHKTRGQLFERPSGEGEAR